MKWFEGEIAQLEEKRGVPRAGSDVEPGSSFRLGLRSGSSFPDGPSQSDVSRRDATRRPGVSLAEVVSRDLLFPWLGFSKNTPLPKFVLSNASLPSADEIATTTYPTNEPPQSTIGLRESTNLLQSIPKPVADFLLEVYISRSMAAYPIFHEKWLRACHRRVIHGRGRHPRELDNPSPYDIFIVSLIMALSLSTAARSKQAKARDMSFKLFRHAVSHIADTLTNDFAGLQALVLLHSYGIMNPAAVNVYYLSSYTMQACIDQGLHREDPCRLEPNVLLRDLRRRVFWTAWELDASSSAGFERPIALFAQDISTAFHSDLEDGVIHTDHIDTRGRRTKFVAGRVRTFRFIEAEVNSVLVHGHPIPTSDETLEAWMEGAERRIHAWHQEVHKSASGNRDAHLKALWEEMALFADIATPQVIVALFRPCPRIKSPTTANLLKAFDASVEVAKGYGKQANVGFGSQKYTFTPVHFVFSAAMVFLHTIRECLPELVSRHSLDEMEGLMSLFTTFFSLAAERWPASARCMEEYHRLLEPVKQRYIQASQPAASVLDLDVDAGAGYLPQYYGWIPSLDAAGLDYPLFEPLPDVTADLWMDGDPTVVNWEEYFNMGPL